MRKAELLLGIGIPPAACALTSCKAEVLFLCNLQVRRERSEVKSEWEAVQAMLGEVKAQQMALKAQREEMQHDLAGFEVKLAEAGLETGGTDGWAQARVQRQMVQKERDRVQQDKVDLQRESWELQVCVRAGTLDSRAI